MNMKVQAAAFIRANKSYSQIVLEFYKMILDI